MRRAQKTLLNYFQDWKNKPPSRQPHTGLLTDTGILRLQLTKYVHLDQLHFSLTITRLDTRPALIFQKLNTSFPLLNLHPTPLDCHMRYATHAFRMDLQTDTLSHMTSQPFANHERAFRNMIRKSISDLWKGQVYNAARIPAGQPTGRKAWYIHIAREDL